MLIDEIKSECWYVFILVVILLWGLIICEIPQREIELEKMYRNWEYNIDCDSGSGFYDAMIKP